MDKGRGTRVIDLTREDPRARMPAAYLLTTTCGGFAFIGSANDVDAHLKRHNNGRGATYTKMRVKRGKRWEIACRVHVPTLHIAAKLENEWKKRSKKVNKRKSLRDKTLRERNKVALDEIMASLGDYSKFLWDVDDFEPTVHWSTEVIDLT